MGRLKGSGFKPRSFTSARCETPSERVWGEREGGGERSSSYRDRKHLNCIETAMEAIFMSNLEAYLHPGQHKHIMRTLRP